MNDVSSMAIWTARGDSILVDREDLPLLAFHEWRISDGYAVATDGGTSIRMHRVIMNCPADMVVDHLNFNRLDNRKANLRICTLSENSRRKRPGAGRKRTRIPREVVRLRMPTELLTRIDSQAKVEGKNRSEMIRFMTEIYLREQAK